MAGCRNIEDLKIPFSAVATDINSGEEVRFKEGPLGQAVQASCSIPGVFRPVKIGERLLVDGGIVDNIPVAAVREFGQRAVVAVDVLRFFDGHKDNLKSGIQVLMKSYQVMVKLISESFDRPADLVIMPHVAGCSFATFHDVATIIRRGEEAARALMPRLRAILEEHARGIPPMAWDE
jgi:NTE family protein